MTNFVKRFARDEEGAALVEYGLLLGFIAVACIAAITALGTDIKAMFNALGGKLPKTFS